MAKKHKDIWGSARILEDIHGDSEIEKKVKLKRNKSLLRYFSEETVQLRFQKRKNSYRYVNCIELILKPIRDNELVLFQKVKFLDKTNPQLNISNVCPIIECYLQANLHGHEFLRKDNFYCL
jgi:hypothetical protein